jgi:hypothetical protein
VRGTGYLGVMFDGSNPAARRNAAAYVRDAFKSGTPHIYVDRGGHGADFTEQGSAMRFVHHGTLPTRRSSRSWSSRDPKSVCLG